MSNKQKSSESEKTEGIAIGTRIVTRSLIDIRKLREWANLSTIAGAIIGIIGIIVSIIDFLGVVQDIPPAIVAIISGILSIGFVLYAIWFLYQRQQKQKKEIADALKRQEQEFLNEINQRFSKLLEEKAG
jgi:type VI protein secretion system component VasK